VITGNWGNDLALLFKAAKDGGLNVKWYTYYAGGAGTPTAIKQTGLDHRVYQISEWHTNVPAPEMEAFADAFLKKHGGASGQGWWYLRMKNQMDMFAEALNKAKSSDPKKVAMALRDMKFKNLAGRRGLHAADRPLAVPGHVHLVVRVGHQA
jgi:branched-chain amino acid transport system substrate-binding protein